jgi:hypothetical protein
MLFNLIEYDAYLVEKSAGYACSLGKMRFA